MCILETPDNDMLVCLTGAAVALTCYKDADSCAIAVDFHGLLQSSFQVWACV